MASGRVKIVKGENKPCKDGEGGKGEAEGDGEDDDEEGDGDITINTWGQKSFDELLEPGAGDGDDPHEANQKREDNEPEWVTEVAAAGRSGGAGQLPAELKRVFGELLRRRSTGRTRCGRSFFAPWARTSIRGGGSTGVSSCVASARREGLAIHPV